jgi:hypothetical protein
MDYISIFFQLVLWIGFVSLVFLKIRHSGRFAVNHGPMPQKTRNLLMWVIFLSGVAFVAWERHLGNTAVLP